MFCCGHEAPFLWTLGTFFVDNRPIFVGITYLFCGHCVPFLWTLGAFFVDIRHLFCGHWGIFVDNKRQHVRK